MRSIGLGLEALGFRVLLFFEVRGTFLATSPLDKAARSLGVCCDP